MREKTARVSQPLGYPALPDPATMSEEKRERRRQALEKWRGLVERAEQGSKDALPAIREVLGDLPELSWRLVNLAKTAEDSLIKEMTSDNDLLAREMLPLQLAAMREELAGPDPSPLERLLVERVVVCWLQLQHADIVYAQHMKNLTLKQRDHYQRWQDRQHNRYLSAIRTLAQVRKLLKPTVAQVNIAEKQVNLAGGELPSSPGQT